MYRRNTWITAAAGALALTIACGRTPNTPVAPTGATSADTSAAADGSTLKATQPVAESPINGTQPEGTLVLTAKAAKGKFTDLSLSHRFEIYNEAKAKVCDSGLVSDSNPTVSFTVTSCPLAFDAPHTWRVRAEFEGAVGPWSADASFRSSVGGYLRGNELFDPLTNGRSTVMQHSNDVTWLPGVGVRLNSKESVVEYRLQQPCVDCEMSAYMTNIGNGSEEWKTKVLSMLQGNSLNITDNPYRVTLDKRTRWEGQGSRIRFTMCSQKFDPTDDCPEPRGGSQNWNRSETYFWKFEWRHGTARLRVYRGGKNGPQIEDLTDEYDAPYAPNPHVVRLGSVGGRAGSDTNPGTIIWNIWVSPNPRPDLPGDR